LFFCEIWHLPVETDPSYEEKFRRSYSICEFLREIDYEIIGFEFAENNLVEIISVDGFENSQRGDYVLFPKSKREELFSVFNN